MHLFVLCLVDATTKSLVPSIQCTWIPERPYPLIMVLKFPHQRCKGAVDAFFSISIDGSCFMQVRRYWNRCERSVSLRPREIDGLTSMTIQNLHCGPGISINQLGFKFGHSGPHEDHGPANRRLMPAQTLVCKYRQ